MKLSRFGDGRIDSLRCRGGEMVSQGCRPFGGVLVHNATGNKMKLTGKGY